MADFLENVSIAQLEEELERRKRQAALPPRRQPADFSKLEAMIVREVAKEAETGEQRKDFQHFVYEEAMMAVFGKAYFEWRNTVHK